MDTLKTLTYDVTGAIARIVLNRPERGNGITFEMPAELAACVERANLDPAVHVIALSGNTSFVAHPACIAVGGKSISGPVRDPSASPNSA